MAGPRKERWQLPQSAAVRKGSGVIRATCIAISASLLGSGMAGGSSCSVYDPFPSLRLLVVE